MRVQQLFKDPHGKPVLIVVSDCGSHLSVRWERENGDDREVLLELRAADQLVMAAAKPGPTPPGSGREVLLELRAANQLVEMLSFIIHEIRREFPETIP